MKTKTEHMRRTISLAAFCICLSGNLMAQSWNITGNAGIAAGTNYLGTSDPNDLVIRTNALERGRVLGSTGEWRFGGTTNYASIDANGRLRFAGTGVYQVGGNKYAFQYSGNPNYGLFFNTTNDRYEFRDGSAAPVFYVTASTGAGTFLNSLKVGAYTLPATDGAANQVLKTNGAGVLSWSNDNGNTYIAGTGLSLVGNTFNNTAPDLNVTLFGTSGITITGTYPNFIASGSGLWKTTGNAGTNGATNFIGTTDDAGFVIRTNNIERIRVQADGDVGIGTTSALQKLHVVGNTYISGNLGVGVTAPVEKLEVYGSAKFSFDGSGIKFAGGGTILDAIGASNILEVHGELVPDNDISHSLGNSTNRWIDIWAQDGTINTSDARDKKNIRDLDYGLKQIMQLHTVKFNWKNLNTAQDKLGVIAQEIQKVLPEVVRDYELKVDEATGKTEKVPSARLGVMYADIIPVLIKGMQEQQQMIEAQNKKIEELTQLVQQNQSVTATVETSNVQTKSIAVNALLEQNAPNPFNSSTVIRYHIPSNAASAQIMITNAAGSTVKTFTLTGKGAGYVTINANELTAGSYYYTLIVDGKKADSKQMILVK